MAFIYKITNNITNKIYIGCTIKDVNKRFKEHISRANTNTHKCKLYNSIHKHGIENFKIEVVCECSQDEMYKLELEFIKEFDSFNSEYNTTLGGEGCLGYTHSEEIKEKMSIIQKDKMLELRMGKSYEEIYSEKRSSIEKEKRSKSGKKYWENCSEEDKMNRTSNQVNTMITKAGLTKELIYEIRKLHSSGIKPKILKEKYSNLTEKQINNIIDKRKWKTIYEY